MNKSCGWLSKRRKKRFWHKIKAQTVKYPLLSVEEKIKIRAAKKAIEDHGKKCSLCKQWFKHLNP